MNKRSHNDMLVLSLILLRATTECFARLGYGLDVRPSVRLSVTLCDFTKTAQARITKSSLWAAPKILIFVMKFQTSLLQFAVMSTSACFGK